MKLIRFGAPGRERPGLILPDGRRIDASSVAADYDEACFASGGLERLVRWFAEDGAAAPVVPDDARLGPPIGRPSKIVCVGLNYRDHARESGMAIPDEPVLFFKATTAITGPNDDVIIPKNASKVDWEVELAVVIGRRAAYVERAKALAHVAGSVLHDPPPRPPPFPRHPFGRGPGPEPAALPRRRRRGGAGHRGSGHRTPAPPCLPLTGPSRARRRSSPAPAAASGGPAPCASRNKARAWSWRTSTMPRRTPWCEPSRRRAARRASSTPT